MDLGGLMRYEIPRTKGIGQYYKTQTSETKHVAPKPLAGRMVRAVLRERERERERETERERERETERETE